DLTEATVEGWVKYETLWNSAQFFDFGNNGAGEMQLGLNGATPDSWFLIDRTNAPRQEILVKDVIKLHQWNHLAAVTGKEGMKLYFMGIWTGKNEYPGSFKAIGNGNQISLGRNTAKLTDPTSPDFHGEMDEVRVWRIARTAEQIRQNMFRNLTGNEPTWWVCG